MSGVCTDCRWWKTGPELKLPTAMIEALPLCWKFCEMTRTRANSVEFYNPTTDRYEVRQTTAMSLDAEDYVSCLATQSDHGCTQFEAKEAQEPQLR